MSSDRRMRQLLERDLDGELSSLESDELTRGLASRPHLRRERQVWADVQRVLAADDEPLPSLARARIERGVMERLRIRPHRRPVRPRARRVRLARGLATLLLTVGGFYTWASDRPLLRAVGAQRALGPTRGPPVSIDVEVAAADTKADERPVTVTF